MKIGIVGLGEMGLSMATRLAAAGHEVIGYNRTASRSQELVRRGGKAAQSLEEAAKFSEVVITMLSDDAVVEEIVLGSGRLIEFLAQDAVHISMSTISPSLSRRLERVHASRKRKFVSAPVLGRPEAAEQGSLFILTSGLTSGETEAMDRVRPVFSALGQRSFELGSDPGAANLVKLCCNFMIASVIESLSETFALVRKAEGIDHEQYLKVLTGTIFTGPVFETYGRHVLEHDFKPGFRVPLALKDLELGIAAGKESAVPLPLASLIRDHLVTAIAQGMENLDWSSLAVVSLRAAGMAPEEESLLPEKKGKRVA